MDLEKRVESAKNRLLETHGKVAGSPLYQYGIDVLSGWMYYTPTYALQELAAVKDIETIVKTRLIGMAVHAAVMRPVGLLRNYVAKKWDVNQDSPLIDKMKVNLVTVTPVQAVAYAGMLAGGMAWS